MQNKLWLFILFTFLLPVGVFATHIVGGELYYKYLGNNQYELRLTVYRDCSNKFNAAYDNPAAIWIYNSNNQLVNLPYLYTGKWGTKYVIDTTFNNNKVGFRVPMLDSDTMPNLISSPCLIPPTDICYQIAHYVDTVTLPVISGGYQLAYQICCRNQTILNIVNPLSTGAIDYTAIPDSSLADTNSSPVFTKLPPTFICVNTPFTFDHSAIDYDGDSLAYNLYVPLNSGNGTYLPPPFYDITWASPYSLSNVLGGTPMTIDSKTGLLTATPNMLGQFVYGVAVKEYRNGVLIGESRRDYQVNVANCPNIVVSSIQSPSLVCDSNKAKFNNKSVGAASYFWDFGVKSLTSDTSSIASPTYTYPDTGVYKVMLVAYSSIDTACNDTSYSNVRIASGLKSSFAFSGGGCNRTASLQDASYSGQGKINYWSWNFGDAGTASVKNPTHTYTDTGTYKIMLVAGTAEGCRDTVNKPITIYPIPKAAFKDSADCFKKTTLTDTSSISKGSITQWLWNFGDNTTATQQNPSHSYNTAAIYPISLLVTSALGCKDSITKNIVVNTTPVASFTNIGACLNDTARFTSTSTISYGSITKWLWNFGDNEIATILNPSHLFATSGVYPVSLKVTSLKGCTDSVTRSVQMYPSPIAKISVVSNPSCNGYCDGLASLTTSGGTKPYNYLWNDGQTTVTAKQLCAKKYNVLLTDSNGCVTKDSTTLTEPLPLLPNPSKTDIICYGACDGTVTATPSAGTAPYTYLWSNQQTTSSIHTACAGTYRITVTDANKCIKMDSVTVEDNTMKPDITASALPYSILEGQSTILTVEINPDKKNTYTWTPTVGLSCSKCESPVAAPIVTTIYKVTAVNEDGCTVNDTVTVKIREPELIVPNVFTPNGDNLNNSFDVKAIGYKTYHIIIYNRWGERVFETHDASEKWNGRIMQTKSNVPDGVYYYLLDVQAYTDVITKRNGFVTLIR